MPDPGPLPTLLALHGAGSSSLIHTIQLARLTRLLKPTFTVTSLNAPFPSPAGPGVLPFFEGCGPYACWLPPTGNNISAAQMRTGTSSPSLAPECEKVVRDAVAEVHSQGGQVVGLIGFSQGSRVVAGLLKARELVFDSPTSDAIPDALRADFAFLRDIRFAVIVCGSFPPPLVPQALVPHLDAVASDPPATGVPTAPLYERRIRTPTLHVQGKMDEWAWAGDMMVSRCYELKPSSSSDETTPDRIGSEVLKLDIGHHYPVKPEESQRVVDWVIATWERTKQ